MNITMESTTMKENTAIASTVVSETKTVSVNSQCETTPKLEENNGESASTCTSEKKRNPFNTLFSDDSKKRFSKLPEKNEPKPSILEDSKGKEVRKGHRKTADDAVTIFVGNLSVEVIQKSDTLKKAFAIFGPIRSLRFRSVSVLSTPISHSDKNLLKKAAVIKGNLNDEKKSVNAYIVFENKESVKKALALNNTVIFGRHIVVDSVEKKERREKGAAGRTLFIGNLPFDCDEEELRQFMENRMQQQKTRNGLTATEAMIESVRLIRSKDTQSGKGFGYVALTSPVYIPLGLLLNDVNYKKRTLRVSKYLKNTEAIDKRKQRDAVRRGRRGAKGKPQAENPTKKETTDLERSTKQMIEKLKKEGEEKKEMVEKKEKTPKKGIAPKKEAPKKEETPKKKEVPKMVTPAIKEGLDLSFMGNKASLSMKAINARKNMTKKGK